MELIYQGAEARVYKTQYSGKDAVLKERFPKEYRHPELEKKLTKSRVLGEVRALERAEKAGIKTPKVFHVDVSAGKITLEFIHGKCLRDVLQDESVQDASKDKIALQLGNCIAQMHNEDIIHGDLTTSNVILDLENELVVIDFGLAKHSTNAEDKAVDLYVLERAFSSTHPGSETLFQQVMQSYENHLTKDKQQVLSKYAQVQKRGRKRMLLG